MGGVVRSTISQWRLWRSVKHEDVYLKGYATMGELTLGLAVYFAFYNGERPHQSLSQQTPGGGVSNRDRRRGDDPGQVQRLGGKVKGQVNSQVKGKTPVQRHSAASEVEHKT